MARFGLMTVWDFEAFNSQLEGEVGRPRPARCDFVSATTVANQRRLQSSGEKTKNAEATRVACCPKILAWTCVHPVADKKKPASLQKAPLGRNSVAPCIAFAAEWHRLFFARSKAHSRERINWPRHGWWWVLPIHPLCGVVFRPTG